ncbi:recombinase family protein [Roseovarius sp. MMSF_3281]|uniref:recombinase family protein n=1 Tax=Roseovarius sp. MMSF_3281 TaxID=3046694 RepID=UPI00273DA70B|nr:recombinase family protein [Roseovarius sp. MMSF_3281]
MGEKIGYRRVSSLDQNLDRQELGNVDKIFEEKLSGAFRERPQLREMIRYARDGDEIVVWSIDRLARNLKDLTAIVEELNAKGAAVYFIKNSLRFARDDDDPQSRLQLHIMSAFAEFERDILKQRQREGIQKAKQKGKYKGRKVQYDHDEIARLIETTDMTITQIARDQNCSTKTVYRVADERFDEEIPVVRAKYQLIQIA